MKNKTKKRYKITREELIDIILKRTEELGRAPKRSEIKEYSAILRVFGSYKEALKILNIEKNVRKGASKEDLIIIIQDKARELGRNPKSNEIKEYNTILRKFGSFDKALLEAGLSPEHIYNRSNEELIKIIVDKYIELGRVPYAKEVKENHTIIRRFGSWNKALDEAGLRFNKPRELTKFEVMNIVYKKAEELQRTPTEKDCSGIMRSVKTYFGSWNNLVLELGLNVNHYVTNIEDTVEELMDKYISLSNRLGKLANTIEVSDYMGISFIVYRKRIGLLGDVQKRAIKSGRLEFDYSGTICERKRYYSTSDVNYALNVLKEANKINKFKTKKEVEIFCRSNKLPSLSYLIHEKKVTSYRILLEDIG